MSSPRPALSRWSCIVVRENYREVQLLPDVRYRTRHSFAWRRGPLWQRKH